MTFRTDRYSVPGYEGNIPCREKPTLRYSYISVCLVLKNNNNSNKSHLKLLKLAPVAKLCPCQRRSQFSTWLTFITMKIDHFR